MRAVNHDIHVRIKEPVKDTIMHSFDFNQTI